MGLSAFKIVILEFMKKGKQIEKTIRTKWIVQICSSSTLTPLTPHGFIIPNGETSNREERTTHFTYRADDPSPELYSIKHIHTFFCSYF
jgi:hypothetical protein